MTLMDIYTIEGESPLSISEKVDKDRNCIETTVVSKEGFVYETNIYLNHLHLLQDETTRYDSWLTTVRDYTSQVRAKESADRQIKRLETNFTVEKAVAYAKSFLAQRASKGYNGASR